MPTISMFYGILIRMYGADHNPPHIHAIYGDNECAFSFDGEIIKGTFPQKQTRLVQAWTELHKEELIANWKLATEGEQLFKIDPLK